MPPNKILKFKFHFELATRLMLQMIALDGQNNNSSAIHTFVSKKENMFHDNTKCDVIDYSKDHIIILKVKTKNPKLYNL